jgi:16S rRNA (uracil1498-N3)-methyltransferase
MELFYTDAKNISEKKITLDSFEVKHIRTTLRKKTGDIIYITDGNGRLIKTRIEKIAPEAELEVIDIQTKKPPPYKLALGMGFIKPARLEWILEKGTELGVNCFFLFRSQYANYFTGNQEKFLKILKQAVKQSQRVFLPQITLCRSLDDFLNATDQYQDKYLAVSPDYPLLLSRLISGDKYKSIPDSVLAIGPEGGFDSGELQAFGDRHYNFVSLGESRLRAETAAISGVTIIKSFYDHITIS